MACDPRKVEPRPSCSLEVRRLAGGLHFWGAAGLATIDQLRTFALLGIVSRSTPSENYMRRHTVIFAVLLCLPSPVLSQTVPEGVHNDVSGPSDVCGVTGEGALTIRASLRSNPAIREEPSGSVRFETYFSSTESKQWSVTTKEDAAYPAVTCVHLFNSGGGTDMQRQMRCDASREACDALFVEFHAHDEEIRKQIRGQ